MANRGAKNKLMSISPNIEMIVRRLYWHNLKYLSSFAIRNKKNKNSQPIDFSKIENFLRNNGVSEGSLICVHSAYGPMKNRGKNYNQIIDFFLDLIGPAGTLAMPAFPKFDNDIDLKDYLNKDPDLNEIFVYDVQNSTITTGVLPLMLNKRMGSVRSRFPINTLVSFGPLSTELYKDELKPKNPLACGDHSAWKKFVNNKAKIISIGTDLTHSLTSIHVSEDSYEENWVIKDWYRKKKFKIIDGEYTTERIIRERRPKWGALHFGERTLCKDLINQGILKTSNDSGVLVEILDAENLNDFLQQMQLKTPGYPYFWLGK